MRSERDRDIPAHGSVKRMCALCGNPAVTRYRQIWICGDCLNPEPSADYLRSERERITGGWGVVSTEDWEYY